MAEKNSVCNPYTYSVKLHISLVFTDTMQGLQLNLFVKIF